ncbi:Phytochrome-like protein cph2 [Thalassocella blandensis]|nr:Phytochrome-like protein cph2 [Thalassocella blandensis]
MDYDQESFTFHINSPQHKYLVADGNGEESRVIRNMLKKIYKEHCFIEECSSFTRLTELLESNSFEALIIADNLQQLLHESISETVAHLETCFPDLPIIIIADVYDSQLAITSISAGAQEYILKRDLSTDLLSRSLHYSIERKLSQLKLKKTLQNISQKNHQLEKLTRYDYLTGLPNRAYFEAAAIKLLLRASRLKKQLAVVLFNLNKFKKINESYGRAGGDELLRLVTYRINQSLRKTDFLSRIGSDEFIIITDMLNDANEIYPLVNRILNCFQADFKLNRHEVKVDVSIGVSFYPNALTLESLHHHADIAMHKAKSDMSKSVYFFSNDMEAHHYRGMQIEAFLQKGIDQHEFFTKYQLLFNARNQFAQHIELLAYWHSSEIGEVSPCEFLPLVRNSPAINNITAAVIQGSKHFYSSGNDIVFHFNIFTRQLNESQFINSFIAEMKADNIKLENICLEINESDIVNSFDHSLENINFLRKQGITLVLDNFGKNLSSVRLLIDLPIDMIKLDHSLIKGIQHNTRAISFCGSIVDFCHKNGITVVAQGIENEQELEVLKGLNVDFFQGFYLSQVAPLATLEHHMLNAS